MPGAPLPSPPWSCRCWPARAADNAAALEEVLANGDNLSRDEPWNELVEIDDIDTTGDGLVTIARLRPKEAIDARLWQELPRERNGLLVSC